MAFGTDGETSLFSVYASQGDLVLQHCGIATCEFPRPDASFPFFGSTIRNSRGPAVDPLRYYISVMGIVSTPDLRAASALFSNNNARMLARLYPERRDNQSIFVLHMDQAMKAVWAFRSGIERDRRIVTKKHSENPQRTSPPATAVWCLRLHSFRQRSSCCSRSRLARLKNESPQTQSRTPVQASFGETEHVCGATAGTIDLAKIRPGVPDLLLALLPSSGFHSASKSPHNDLPRHCEYI